MKPGRLGPLSLLPALLLSAAACGSRVPQVDRVIFVTLDTTRADRLGCYGYADADTPNLDRLADEAVLFEETVSPVPTTLPSHSTMFTGLLPQDHGVRYNIFYRLTDEATTLAETLQQAGFATAAFPASHIVAKRYGLSQGFDTWVEPPDPQEQQDGDHPDSVRRSAADGVDQALGWLSDQPGGRQFVWLHFYDAHAPYAPPFPYSSRYRDRPYDGGLAYIDSQMGRLLEGLRNDPSWARTLLIVVGDHGEGLYDHDERFHSLLAYQSTQRVPLLIRAPGAGARRVAEPVMLADLMPTVLDLAGVAEPSEPMRGVSLRKAVEGGRIERRDLYFEAMTGAIIYGWAELEGIRYGDWKLIDSLDPELFDLSRDPDEENNLVAEEPERLAELRAALSALKTPISSAGEHAESSQNLDSKQLAMLASLGYIAGGTSASSGADAPQPRRLVSLQPEMLAAQAWSRNGEFARVEETCRYVLTRDPGNKWAIQGLVSSLMSQGRVDEALEYALDLVERHPSGDQPHLMLARVYRERGETENAFLTLQAALEKHPNSEPIEFLAAVAAFDMNEATVCSKIVPSAVENHPDSGRVLVLRARCEARDGQEETSLATLTRSAELDFKQFDILQNAPDMAKVVSLAGFQTLLLTAEMGESLPESATMTVLPSPTQ